ncbi:MAG: LEA type 2 family protein [Chloracidobacterium sp.]|nr:LEA type 2 family protein [Chloracidobacterium sp.]MDW8216087.1 LEA type 2 family protein [Acidobacteriota bacterium]
MQVGSRRRFLTWVGMRGGAAVLLSVSGVGVRAGGQDEGKLPKGFREPTLTLKGLRVERVDYPDADFRATVTIHNPNRELKLTDLTYRLTLNGVECGRGRRPEKLVLPKKGALDVVFPITGDLSTVPQLGLNTLLASGLGEGVRLRYVIDVEFDVGVLLLFKRRIQAKLKGEMSLREIVVRMTPIGLGVLRRDASAK